MMKKFLTSKEAADYLGIPEGELENLVDEKKLPSYRIGGLYTRFKVDDLDYYSRKFLSEVRRKENSTLPDKIKDFFYFNDFYIFSFIAIIVVLYFIFR